jgi:hypothetical protein
MPVMPWLVCSADSLLMISLFCIMNVSVTKSGVIDGWRMKDEWEKKENIWDSYSPHRHLMCPNQTCVWRGTPRRRRKNAALLSNRHLSIRRWYDFNRISRDHCADSSIVVVEKNSQVKLTTGNTWVSVNAVSRRTGPSADTIVHQI